MSHSTCAHICTCAHYIVFQTFQSHHDQLTDCNRILKFIPDFQMSNSQRVIESFTEIQSRVCCGWFKLELVQ